MSSVSWDRAPTRRASADRETWRASAAMRAARSDCTTAYPPAPNTSPSSTTATAMTSRSRRISTACRLACSAADRSATCSASREAARKSVSTGFIEA